MIRSLIEATRLLPVNGKLELALAGDLAGILALTNDSPRRIGQGAGNAGCEGATISNCSGRR